MCITTDRKGSDRRICSKFTLDQNFGENAGISKNKSKDWLAFNVDLLHLLHGMLDNFSLLVRLISFPISSGTIPDLLTQPASLSISAGNEVSGCCPGSDLVQINVAALPFIVNLALIHLM